MVKYKYVVLYGDNGVSQEFDTPIEAENWARNFQLTLGFKGLIEIDKITIIPKKERWKVSGGEVDWTQGHYKTIQKGTKQNPKLPIGRSGIGLDIHKETGVWD